MLFFRSLLLALFFPVWVSAAQAQIQTPSAEPNLTEEEMKQFLLTAKVVKNEISKKGITRPYKLTLSDGRLTHKASFQTVDIYKPFEKFDNGTTEINFRDTYHFNIAAYQLAKLLGLERMMPVTVERKWNGKIGSLTWWLKSIMDEDERLKKNIHPPDVEAWNRQMHRKRVFAELVCDVDINVTNVLIGEHWELYMIDFTRAFRLHEKLPKPKDLQRCDRQLLEKLRQLDKAEIARVTSPHLSDREIKALLIRRDLILDHFQQLIKAKGEKEVLY
jgi:hypothetical protein